MKNKVQLKVYFVKLIHMLQTFIFQWRSLIHFDIFKLAIRPTLSNVECMHIMFINYKLMLGHNILYPKGTKDGYPHFTSGH